MPVGRGDVLAGVEVAGAGLAEGAGDRAADRGLDRARAAAAGGATGRPAVERLGRRGAVGRRVGGAAGVAGRGRRGRAGVVDAARGRRARCPPCGRRRRGAPGAVPRRRASTRVVDGHDPRAAAADEGHVGVEQRGPGRGVDLAGHREAVALLEALDGRAGDRAEDAVVVHADLALDGGHRRARVALGQQGRRTARWMAVPRGRGSTRRRSAAGGRQRGERRGRRAVRPSRRSPPGVAPLRRAACLRASLGDLAPVDGPPQRALPQLEIAQITVGAARRMGTTADNLTTPWGLAPTGLAVGLAQACATPPSAAIRPIGLTRPFGSPVPSRPRARELGCASFERRRLHDAGAELCKGADGPAARRGRRATALSRW